MNAGRQPRDLVICEERALQQSKHACSVSLVTPRRRNGERNGTDGSVDINSDLTDSLTIDFADPDPR
jgi:hypothetical protein